MRRRRPTGALVLLISFLLSAGVHLLAYWPVAQILEAYLTAPVNRPKPVKMVRMSPSAWTESMRSARRAAARRRALSPPKARAKLEKKKLEKKKPEEKKPDQLKGQVVEVPPTPDDSPNPDAKYLSKYNTNVKKETVARMENRDPKQKRVTNKLQTKQSAPRREAAVRSRGLTVEGDGLESTTPGEAGQSTGGKQQFVLEVPDLKRRDEVDLKLTDLPGRRNRFTNREGSEALRGNADRFRLELGQRGGSEGGQAGGKKGGKERSLPSLSSLRPTLGTVARISGSPSRDYVEGVPEGEGTFLNTKEFKYATFFFRVRDSVASRWDSLLTQEYRRRDPTGSIYGVRDRSTVLHIKLALDGSLSGVRVSKTSGVDFLDQVAVQAFKMAEPFPNPPAAMADQDGYIRFNFQFVVVMSSSSPLRLFR